MAVWQQRDGGRTRFVRRATTSSSSTSAVVAVAVVVALAESSRHWTSRLDSFRCCRRRSLNREWSRRPTCNRTKIEERFHY